jgi:hypothetical protein
MRYLTYVLLAVTFLTWANAGRADESAFELEGDTTAAEFSAETPSQTSAEPSEAAKASDSQTVVVWPGMPFDSAGPNESLQ